MNNANRIINAFVIISLLFLLLTGFAAAATEIRTLDELMAIDDSAANLNLDYILMNDIDVSGSVSFMPIGTNSDPFTGKFDGNGYTISNITFIEPTTDYVGLFGFTDGASISNLSLKNIDLEGQDWVGGLIGYTNNTSVSQCSVENLDAYQISGREHTGGFVGHVKDSEISESYATSNVYGTIYAGGFVGRMAESKISKSYATGNVENTRRGGGFIGFMQFNSEISESYATGNATGNSYTAGFVGGIEQSKISKSYATGNVESESYIGGFAGTVVDAEISECYATGNANGISNFGGFVGHMASVFVPPTITDSFYIGTPDSNNNSKGFFVTSDELKKRDTFTTNGGYISTSWDISSSSHQVSVWYINEGNGYPKFEWYEPEQEPPAESKKGGTGTGSATIVNNTSPQNVQVVDNTPQNITPLQNKTPISEDVAEPEPTTPYWLLLLIGTLLSIFIFAIILYKRRKDEEVKE